MAFLQCKGMTEGAAIEDGIGDIDRAVGKEWGKNQAKDKLLEEENGKASTTQVLAAEHSC